MSVAYDFWQLPASERRKIIRTLGDLNEAQSKLPEQHRVNLAFATIGERNLTWRLVEMIAKAA